MSKGSGEWRGNPGDDEILRTAAEAFIKFGFAGMSMRDLAKKCGTTASLFYYRFGSKEALYSEACQVEINAFFESISEKLHEYPAHLHGTETLAAAFFDAWVENPNALLLTSTDVANTQASPERVQISEHFQRMVGLVRRLCSERLAVEVSDDFCFEYTAIIFGICSLTALDRHFRSFKGQPFDRDAYHQYRKKTLVKLCGSLEMS